LMERVAWIRFDIAWKMLVHYLKLHKGV